MKKFLLLLFIFGSIFSTTAQEQKISQRLLDRLANSEAQDFIRTLVIFEDQVDVRSMDDMFYAENASIERRTLEVITALKQKANSTQSEMISYLAQKESENKIFRYEPMWIVNMIVVEAQPEVIYELAAKQEVHMVDYDGLLERDPVYEERGNVPGLESVEAGVRIINAHLLWEIGITGAGRIVMGIDTGVDPTHPALSYKWRGNHVPAAQAWIDPGGGTTTPNDCDSHGTHTMGTMTGRSTTTADTVGVAIDAEWIAAKTICSSPHTSNSVAAFQWAIDPDGDSTTISDMPDAICNSWYDPNITNECSSIYVGTFNAVEAAGIAVVFSAGNSGPSSSTITIPKNINTDLVNSWATAAIDGPTYLGGSNDPITSFSSRGPSQCGGTGSLLIKPEASAPGNNVRSSIPGGGYGTKSGTSMAAPHVVGAIALLKQFAPQLTGTQIKLALYNTAQDLGTPGEDNTYGMGLIDVYAAFLSLGTPDMTPPDPIVDLAVTETTSNTLSLSWTVPGDTSMGGVTSYDIRWSGTMINDTNDFNAAAQLTFEGQPQDSGQVEMFVHDGLPFSTDYYYSIRCGDVWGNWSDMSNVVMGTTFDAPVADVTPDSLHMVLSASTTETDTVYLSNISTGNSTLDYNITLENNVFPNTKPINVRVLPHLTGIQEEQGDIDKENPQDNFGMSLEGAGGPDLFGYEWIDSNEPGGPAYVWEDITGTGTQASTWTATGTFDPLDEGYAGPLAIGFPFKFYGVVKNDIYVSSNGMVMFTVPTANIFSNQSIPNPASQNDYIAPFWDDLDGRSQGTVHYKQDGSRFIVQFTNWQKYSGTGSLTFQIVLYASGRIVFYFEDMNASLTSATVGIENEDGSDGLQIAYNAAYITNGLAIKIQAEPDWLTPDHISGRLYNGNTAVIELSFSDDEFPAGDYSMDLVITSNDPVNSTITVPVTMEILEIPVELTSFKADLMNNVVGLIWQTATETNNMGFDIERKLQDAQWSKLGFKEGMGNSTETVVYNFEDSFDGKTYTGTVYYRLKQIDLDGSVNYSDAIQVDVDFTPKSYSLEQNYPNPFNPSTKIKYSLPYQSNVKLTVYNALGETAVELVNNVQETGYYEVQFDASKLASGLYIYTLEADAVDRTNNFRNSMKMLLIK